MRCVRVCVETLGTGKIWFINRSCALYPYGWVCYPREFKDREHIRICTIHSYCICAFSCCCSSIVLLLFFPDRQKSTRTRACNRINGENQLTPSCLSVRMCVHVVCARTDGKIPCSRLRSPCYSHRDTNIERIADECVLAVLAVNCWWQNYPYENCYQFR